MRSLKTILRGALKSAPQREDFAKGKKGDKDYNEALLAYSVACDKTYSVAEVLLEAFDSDYSRELLADYRSGGLAVATPQLPDPRRYDSADVFAADYLCYNLLRKGDFHLTGVDSAQVALDKFKESEAKCRRINHRLREPTIGHLYCANLHTSFEAVIHTAKRRIGSLLGDFSWAKVERYFGFSGGATTRLPRKNGHAFYKYQGNPHVTIHASTAAWCAIQNAPAWATLFSQGDGKLEYVVGSQAKTVPKDASTDRFICVEPDMNMYLQKGVGGFIRSRLKTVGIDLNDQASNQRLAEIGSRTGSLVTIDLKSASDSIALELVNILLEPQWAEILLMLRSPLTQLPDGSWCKLEKISSMGNGYTFELESLIFWALSTAVLDCHGCEDRRLGVYGDDIVIHNSVAESLIDIFDMVGFTTNQQKTFIDGPFRESCGKHYFYGQDVSPFFIKHAIQFDEDKYHFINQLNTWLSRHMADFRGLRVMRRIIRILKPQVNHVPSHLGTKAGVWVPSVIYADTFYVTRERQRQTHGGRVSGVRVAPFVGGYIYKALRPVRRKHNPNGAYAVLTALASAGAVASRSRLQIEKGEVVFSRFTRYTTYWPNSDVRFVVKHGHVSLLTM